MKHLKYLLLIALLWPGLAFGGWMQLPGPAVQSVVSGSTLIATDDFNRTTLGSDWTTSPGAGGFVTVSSTHAKGTTTGVDAIYFSASSFTADQSSSIEQGAVYYGGPTVRTQTSGTLKNFYGLMVGPSTVEFKKFVDNVESKLGSTYNYSTVTGDTWRLKIVGDTLTAYLNGNLVMTAPGDSTFLSGPPGIMTVNRTATYNSWAGYNE